MSVGVLWRVLGLGGSAMAAQVALGGATHLYSCSIACVSSSVSSNPSKLQPRAFGSSRNVRLDNASASSSHAVRAKKKMGWFDDPFDYGPDDEEDTMGELMSQGAQGAEDPIPERDEENEFGYLDFPAGFMPEVSALGTLIRNDIRRCLCFISGGVYDNLLFFPVIQLLKNRYPGVKIDVMATPRGKQVSSVDSFNNCPAMTLKESHGREYGYGFVESSGIDRYAMESIVSSYFQTMKLIMLHFILQT